MMMASLNSKMIAQQNPHPNIWLEGGLTEIIWEQKYHGALELQFDQHTFQFSLSQYVQNPKCILCSVPLDNHSVLDANSFSVTYGYALQNNFIKLIPYGGVCYSNVNWIDNFIDNSYGYLASPPYVINNIKNLDCN